MRVIDIDDEADDAAIEDFAAQEVNLKLRLNKQEATFQNPTVVEQTVPALLVDRNARQGRIRTSDGKQILRTGPEQNYKTKRALVMPENGEKIVLLGAPLVRLTQSTT